MRPLFGALLAAASLASPILCFGQEAVVPNDTTGLQVDLAAVIQEIKDAQAKDAQYEGGLIKSLIEARIEILRTTKALLEQRILTIETRTPTTVQVPITKPDPERAAQLDAEIQAKQRDLDNAKAEAAKYSGGLVKAMKLSSVATIEQTLALLSQEYLRSKYGLALLPPTTKQDKSGVSSHSAQGAAQVADTAVPARTIVIPDVSNLRYEKEKYEEFMLFDVLWVPQHLTKPTRSIKGALLFEDLFGDVRFGLNVTIDQSIEPGQSVPQKGIGFRYNHLIDKEVWMRTTDLKDMKVEFQVKSILYMDGTREDF
jgi:hypothetical protein